MARDSVRSLPEMSIDPTRLYAATEVMERMGWRPAGWRAARRNGLLAYRSGRRWYALGADVVAFVTGRRDR